MIVNTMYLKKEQHRHDSDWLWNYDIMSIPNGSISGISLNPIGTSIPRAEISAPPWAVASTHQTQWCRDAHLKSFRGKVDGNLTATSRLWKSTEASWFASQEIRDILFPRWFSLVPFCFVEQVGYCTNVLKHYAGQAKVKACEIWSETSLKGGDVCRYTSSASPWQGAAGCSGMQRAAFPHCVTGLFKKPCNQMKGDR